MSGSRVTFIGDAMATVVDPSIAADIAIHVDLWFVRRHEQALRWIGAAGGGDVTPDDVGLVSELLLASAWR